MRILFLSENYPPEVNAIASRVSERARLWVASGHDVTVITGFPNFPQGKLYAGYKQRLYQIDHIDGVRVVRVPTYIARNEGFVRRTLDFLSFMCSAIVAGFFTRRPDIVVATSPQFFTGVAGWVVGVFRWRPFVFEVADLWPASIVAVGALRPGIVLRLLECLELFLYRRARAVVVLTSPFKADLIRRGIDAGKVAVILNGADLTRFAPSPRNQELAHRLGLEGRFVVGYIGTHGMAHALQNVLASAALLRARNDVRFLFVGDGAARRSLEATAQSQGLTNVVFVPAQPKEQMPDYWSLCDVALIHLKNDPVFAEVIPSKIFEAMAMGLPLLIAAPGGEATRIVSECAAGVIVEPERPQRLAEAVERLAGDPAGLRRFAAGSLASAPLYSRDRQARDMVAVLQRVVDDDHRAMGEIRP
jgi:glycosyltransferase involved in cell wall biosynthesis